MYSVKSIVAKIVEIPYNFFLLLNYPYKYAGTYQQKRKKYITSLKTAHLMTSIFYLSSNQECIMILKLYSFLFFVDYFPFFFWGFDMNRNNNPL